MNCLKFKDLRKYISKIDLLSICTKEDLSYENFRLMNDVPPLYDEYYVYGIGMIESEFPAEWICNPKDLYNGRTGMKTVMESCLEIMVSKTPKE